MKMVNAPNSSKHPLIRCSFLPYIILNIIRTNKTQYSSLTFQNFIFSTDFLSRNFDTQITISIEKKQTINRFFINTLFKLILNFF
jgi:hypothetical protein